MILSEYIKLLKNYPKDMIVIRPQWSEHKLMEESDIHIRPGCEARHDGWIQESRPDMPQINYLVIG